MVKDTIYLIYIHQLLILNNYEKKKKTRLKTPLLQSFTRWHTTLMQCLKPLQIRNPKKNFIIGVDELWLTVPCGKCYACQSNKRSFWTCRLFFEAATAISSIFVTLTYDDAHIPHSGLLPTLSKRDVQLFIKRLRKRFPQHHIKYFLCGEYGSHTARPHYHAIIFDLPLCGNFVDYYHKELSKLWTLGFVQCANVNINRIGYVSKYILKSDNDKKFFQDHDLTPPFMLSSRRPAIGAAIADKIKDYLSPDMSCIHYRGQTFLLPRYVKEKLPDYLQNAIDDKRYEYVKNVENNNKCFARNAPSLEKVKRYYEEKTKRERYQRKLQTAKQQLIL